MSRLLIRLFVFVAVLLSGAYSAYAACTASYPAGCNDATLCHYATNSRGSWDKDYPLSVQEAKRRGLSCIKKRKQTKLEKQFKRFPLVSRKKVQDSLSAQGFYRYSIDGLYGKNTDAALKAYNKEFLKDADLEKEKM